MFQLWDELRDMDVEEERLPTARALEDWQAEGLVNTERTGAGRGKGSVSRYEPGTAEKVMELLTILEEERSFDWVRMVLFYRGFSVDFEKLRGSYIRVFTAFPDGENVDIEEFDRAARKQASKHARTGQRRIISEEFDSPSYDFRKEPPDAVLASVLRNIIRMLAGRNSEPLTPEDSAEIAVAHGIPLEIWNELPVSEVEAFEDKLNIRWIRNRIDAITEAEMVEARDRLKEALGALGLEPADLEDTFAPVLPITQIFAVDEAPPDI